MIDQPADSIITTTTETIEIKWRKNFSADWNNRLANGQNRLCSDVLTLSEPFTPRLTGYLISTGQADGQNGVVRWTAPYASYQYYLPARKHAGLRGSFWFEKMKKANLPTLVANVKEELR